MTDQVSPQWKEPRPKRSKVRDFAAELDRVRPVIEARSGGRCEVGIPGVCKGRAATIHHKLPRGQGGTNSPSNLLHACGDGVAGCHGYIESHRAESYEKGWLLRR